MVGLANACPLNSPKLGKRAVSYTFQHAGLSSTEDQTVPKSSYSNVLRKRCLPKPARQQSLFICKDLKIFQMNIHKKQDIFDREASDTVQERRPSRSSESMSVSHRCFSKFPLLHPPTVNSTVSLSDTSSSLLSCCHIVERCHNAPFSSSSAMKQRSEENL